MTVVAAGALLLGAGSVSANANGSGREASAITDAARTADTTREDPLTDRDLSNQGLVYCDKLPSEEDPGFYPGKSASMTYDKLFSRVGTKDDTVPGLKGEWRPQGLAYWANWNGKGDDLLLVTAYKPGRNSRIYGLDAATGKRVGDVDIHPDHVGGIVVLRDWAYVSGKRQPEGGKARPRTIRRYDLDKLRKAIAGGDQAMLEDFEEQEVPRSGFLGTDGKVLYAGEFSRLDRTKMQTYSVQGNGALNRRKVEYWAPLATQGVTVAGGKFVFSVSSDRDDGLRSYLYITERKPGPRFEALDCYRAPSMSEGMATHGTESYLLFESGAANFTSPENKVKHVHVAELAPDDGGGDPGDDRTSTTYSGPAEADFSDAFTASARVTGPSGPVEGARVRFSLGSGGGTQSCSGRTGASGTAKCSLTAAQRPGRTTLTASFDGADGLAPSSDSVSFTVTKQETALKYTGPSRVANGTPARLSGVLTEESASGPPVARRKVTLALGKGDKRQACEGTSDKKGSVECTIESVNQPLNEDATVPVSVAFQGDAYYEPSAERTTALLEFYTGRSYGLRGNVDLLDLAGLEVAPSPDTGSVRTAQASRTALGCTAQILAPLLRSGTLCPSVVTTLAPGTSRATTSVQDATIGLPGLPLIEVEGATARSTSTCGSGGSARGGADVRLRIAGETVDVTGAVNAEIDLPGNAKLVVNEQRRVPDADHGLTVNAVHLVAADRSVDLVIASAQSGVHNCAS